MVKSVIKNNSMWRSFVGCYKCARTSKTGNKTALFRIFDVEIENEIRNQQQILWSSFFLYFSNKWNEEEEKKNDFMRYFQLFSYGRKLCQTNAQVQWNRYANAAVIIVRSDFVMHTFYGVGWMWWTEH